MQAFDGGVGGERGQILLTVVVNTNGRAFDVFIEAFALLAEIRQIAAARRAGGVLIALRVLRHFDPIGFDHDRAFGGDHMARKDVDLFEVVVSHVVRFDVQRLVLVGAVGVRKRREASKRQRDNQRSESGAARGQGARAAGIKTGERFVHAVTPGMDYPGCLGELTEPSDAAIAPFTLPNSCITRVTLL